MAQNYTKMWDAFLGGEWEGGTEATEGTDYLQQTRDFYSNILGPAFDLPDFGEAEQGHYATFSNVDFESAERIFRSEIGDPYGTDDPFSWEKVSRYNTEDFAGVGRLQDLLVDQLYGQGKFLGGQVGADYGTATTRGLETYTTGITGEREGLTYGQLTSEPSLASGTSGAIIRSEESSTVAEDVLIEAYKKARTLGSDYRAGSELIEQDLSEDLDAALTTYLDAIDEEKKAWFSDVMWNVQTYKAFDAPEGEEYETLTDQELAALMSEGLEGMAGNIWWIDHYSRWECGYGQEPDGAGGCRDTTGEGGYEEEVAGYQFREDDEGACGIGELYNKVTGMCEVMGELDLEYDDYGELCPSTLVDKCGVCDGDNSTCDDGCGPNKGPASHICWDGTLVCRSNECSDEPVDECGVPSGDGPQYLCPSGQMACEAADCVDSEPTFCPEGAHGCDPSGQPYCNEGYHFEWDEDGGSQCFPDAVEEGDPGTGNVDVLCNEGTDYEYWDTGNSETDYTNCYDPNTVHEGDYKLCNNGYYSNDPLCEDCAGNTCPEDQPQGCSCKTVTNSCLKPGGFMGWCQEDQLVCADLNDNEHGHPCVRPDPGPGDGGAPALPTAGG